MWYPATELHIYKPKIINLQCNKLPKDDMRSLPVISFSQIADSLLYNMPSYEHNSMHCPQSDSSSATFEYIKTKITAAWLYPYKLARTHSAAYILLDFN